MKKFDGYMHGVNLGGWLSQCDHTKERYDTFVTEADIEKIKGWGLDHFRVPVDYNLFEDENGNYIESGFEYIQKAIDWAGKYGLNMVLDVHKTYGFSFDAAHGEFGFFENEDYQERFYRMWEELSRRYGKYSDRVSFELLNEVTDKEYCDTWNAIVKKCIGRIRAIAPDVKILVGGYYNNSIEALKDLEAPYDENIIYNFHCYEPLIFTHQGAYWIDGMDTSFRMPFEASYKDYTKYMNENIDQFTEPFDAPDENAILGIEFFEHMIEEAVRVANERNVALYCGEYGVIDRADPEDALKWYKMITSVFDKYEIGRAAWSIREMDFGLVDEHMAPVIDELVKYL